MNDKRTDDCDRPIFTLDKPISYKIQIAGQLSEDWSDWMDKTVVRVEKDASGLATTATALTGTFDQAALIGLLRRLYYLGFPLISVNCIQPEEKEDISNQSG